MFGSNVENSLIFEISKFKICLAFSKIIKDHLIIIVCNCVMNWKVPIIILSIKFWTNSLNDICFAFNANYMLDGLSFVILLASCSKKVIVGFEFCSLEPIKNFNCTLSCAHKKHIFSKVILNYNCLSFHTFKYLE